MLGIPEHGWVMFNVSDTVGYDLSYLTNVAIEWMRNATYGLKNMTPFAVEGFCEPGRMLCTVSYWKCYVFFEDEDKGGDLLQGPFEMDMSMGDFCKTLYNDINDNLEAWVTWYTGGSYETSEDMLDLNERRNELIDALAGLKAAIEENGQKFNGEVCFF